MPSLPPPPLTTAHLPAELAAGRFPAGPFATTSLRYWHGRDGRLHGNRFCPRLAAGIDGEHEVVLAHADPMRFCDGCCDRLPEPGPALPELARYLDCARGLADDADRLAALSPARSRPGDVGPWGMVARLASERALLSRRSRTAPPPLDTWALALAATCEQHLAGWRDLAGDGGTRAGRWSKRSPVDGIVAAVLLDPRSLGRRARRIRGDLVERWIDAVTRRLHHPIDAATGLGDAALVELATGWTAGAADRWARRGPDRILAVSLDPASCPPAGPLLVLLAAEARWGDPLACDGGVRLVRIPSTVSLWATRSGAARWVEDLGEARPGDAGAVLRDAALLCERGASSPASALATARGLRRSGARS